MTSQLYNFYLLILIVAFLMVIFIVNCLASKFAERRFIIAFLVMNLLSLIIFADFRFYRDTFNHLKYLTGFTLITLSNIFLEASIITFIMKMLSHYQTSRSSLMNSGFLLECIEILSKLLTIGLIVFGMNL